MQNTVIKSQEKRAKEEERNMLGPKTCLGKFKKIKIISSIFSDQNFIRLKINYKEKNAKDINTWILNMLLCNQWITTDQKRNLKNTWRQVKIKTERSKICGMQQK